MYSDKFETLLIIDYNVCRCMIKHKHVSNDNAKVRLRVCSSYREYIEGRNVSQGGEASRNGVRTRYDIVNPPLPSRSSALLSNYLQIH